MFPATCPLPFSIVKVHGGLSEANGLARVNPNGLLLEYQVSLLGFFKLPIREICIPLEEITSITLKKNLLQTRILLQASSLRTLVSIPGSKSGQLQLRIAKADQEVAAHLVSALRLYLSEQALRRLSAEWPQEEWSAG